MNKVMIKSIIRIANYYQISLHLLKKVSLCLCHNHYLHKAKVIKIIIMHFFKNKI